MCLLSPEVLVKLLKIHVDRQEIRTLLTDVGGRSRNNYCSYYLGVFTVVPQVQKESL